MREYLVRRIDGCASWSRTGIEIAGLVGLPSDRSVAVFSGVVPNPNLVGPRDESERQTERARRGIPASAFAIGYIGRYVDEKGALDVIEACRTCGVPNCHLDYWGGSPLASELTKRLLGAGLNGGIHESLGAEEVAHALGALDVLVLACRSSPRWAEQFGRVVVEA